MSFMKGDLLNRTRRLVKGLAKAEPMWLKAMEQAPPATFPCVRTNCNPSVYQRMFTSRSSSRSTRSLNTRMLLSLSTSFVVQSRVESVYYHYFPIGKLGMMEYQAEKKGKNKAYSRLKKIARLQGRKPPANPYPSAIMEIQAEERPFGCDRFYN
ncbi:putative polyphosphoinositide phosphatase-like [Capsicum annuum]|nr:putative polyphosphoinositide phosphatase-like [Capsicum annuum]